MYTLIQKFAVSWIIALLLIRVCHWNRSRVYSLAQIKIIKSLIRTLYIIYILLLSKLLMKGILLTYHLCVIIKYILNCVHLLSTNRWLTIEILSNLFWIQVCIMIISNSLCLKILVNNCKWLIFRMPLLRILLVHVNLSLKHFTLPIRKVLRSIVF